MSVHIQIVFSGTEDEVAWAKRLIERCTKSRVKSLLFEFDGACAALNRPEIRRSPHQERLAIRAMLHQLTGLKGYELGLPKVEGEESVYG